MIKIAFWNINGKNITDILLEFIIEYDCDIAIFAESGCIDLENFCNLLSFKGKNFCVIPQISCERIRIIADRALQYEHLNDGEYYSILNFKYFNKEFLITSVHLPSKLHAAEADQKEVARQIVENIQDVEKETRHSNTIIIGDFNANPFEQTCINAGCFHGVPSAKISKRIKRIVFSTEFRMFYNPMWNFFGDKTTPVGTYFYNSSKHQNYFWNIFDQVMFRPQMIESVDLSSLKIIASIGNTSLLNDNGIPDKTKFSDHLPIFFKMKEEKLK